nr:glycosyltransferase family 2 protein [Geoanaerobacter pelophilus]
MTIYILCHNRPDFARQTIQSVLGQSSQAFELIVSDNSSNDDVGLMLGDEFPDVTYIRRAPMLQPLEHFNRCIEEAQTDYFCLFHDDDVMSQDYVEEMEKCLEAYPLAIALGCNAKIESFGKLEARSSFRSFRQHEIIKSPQDLARRYFSGAQSGIAPFPGYLYNRQLVADERLPVEGGKYADVTWLLNLAGKGSVVWINKPLMTYRIHGSSDGTVESLRDRLRFLGYLKKNRTILGNGVLSDYRSFIYKKFLKSEIGSCSKRYLLAASFLKSYRWSRYARADYWMALAVRTVVKFAATS